MDLATQTCHLLTVMYISECLREFNSFYVILIVFIDIYCADIPSYLLLNVGKLTIYLVILKQHWSAHGVLKSVLLPVFHHIDILSHRHAFICNNCASNR
jgi:hypothetical protein